MHCRLLWLTVSGLPVIKPSTGVNTIKLSQLYFDSNLYVAIVSEVELHL